MRRGALAGIAVLLLSFALAGERAVAHDAPSSSWAMLTALIASGPLHPFAEAFREGIGAFDLVIPLLLGGIAVHQLWRGIWRERGMALAIGVSLWVLIGYTSAVLLWEI